MRMSQCCCGQNTWSRQAHICTLLVVPAERRREIARQLLPSMRALFSRTLPGRPRTQSATTIFSRSRSSLLVSAIRRGGICGYSRPARQRPAILVYAREATFQLWSGVLESEATTSSSSLSPTWKFGAGPASCTKFRGAHSKRPLKNQHEPR